MGLSRRWRRSAGSPGRAIVALGIVGIVLGLGGAVLAWLLVDGALDSLEESLLLTDEALVAVSDTIGVAEEVVAGTAAGLESVAVVVGDVDSALSITATVLDEADVVLAETVPDGIDAVRRPLPGLIRSSEVVVSALSSLPFVGDSFTPDPPPAESLRAIDDELAGLADRLRDPTTRLARVGDEFGRVGEGIDAVGGRLQTLITTLADAEAVLADYDVATARASAIVDAEVADLGWRRLIAAVMVVLFAVVVVIGHTGLVILGRALQVGDGADG